VADALGLRDMLHICDAGEALQLRPCVEDEGDGVEVARDGGRGGGKG
jgi:hypothetical protein